MNIGHGVRAAGLILGAVLPTGAPEHEIHNGDLITDAGGHHWRVSEVSRYDIGVLEPGVALGRTPPHSPYIMPRSQFERHYGDQIDALRAQEEVPAA